MQLTRVLNVAVLASSAGSCGEDRRASAVGAPRTSNPQLMSSSGQSNEIYDLLSCPVSIYGISRVSQPQSMSEPALGRRFVATRLTSISAERHTHLGISMAAW